MMTAEWMIVSLNVCDTFRHDLRELMSRWMNISSRSSVDRWSRMLTVEKAKQKFKSWFAHWRKISIITKGWVLGLFGLPYLPYRG